MSLIKIRDKLEGHVAEPKECTDVFKLSKSFVGALVKKEKAWCIKIPGANGILKQELCPGKTLGRELADYAVAYGVKGLIHSDEDLKKYNLANEFEELEILLQARQEDAIVLIAGNHAKRAIDAVRERVKILLTHIPEETRVANLDGTTKYTRPLPGSGRMYPETDLEPILVTHDLLKRIKIPETWEEKRKKFLKILPKEMVDQILKSEYLELFEKYSKSYDPVLVASIFTSTLKDLRRSGTDTSSLEDSDFFDILDMIKSNKISKEAVYDVLEKVASSGVNAEKAVELLGIKTLDSKDLEKMIDKIVKKNEKLVKDKNLSVLMGETMKQVKGRIDGSVVSKILKKKMDLL